MKTLKTTLLISIAIISVLAFNSCKKDKDEEPATTTTTPPYVACAPATVYTPNIGNYTTFNFQI